MLNNTNKKTIIYTMFYVVGKIMFMYTQTPDTKYSLFI